MTRRWRRCVLAGLALALAGALQAQPAPVPVRAEVELLLGRLAASGCEFQRNGSWHNAAQAASHLRGKLDYLERRQGLKSTEQFIDQGASSSSTSGKPYLVKCGDKPALESRNWLLAELQLIRAASGAGR